MEKWLNDLSAQYLPYTHGSFKGQEGRLQLGVREVKLLEITFPEEQIAEVLKIVRPQKDNALKRILSILARFLGGLDPVPEYDNTGIFSGGTLIGTGWTFYRVLNEGVTVTGIGTKKDARDADGTELI